MHWFPCFGKSDKKAKKKKNPKDQIQPTSENAKVYPSLDVKELPQDGSSGHIRPQRFTVSELAAATKNFGQDCLLEEKGFGRVYRWQLETTNQIVAIEQLDRDREFLLEVLRLNLPPDKKRLDWNTRMKIATGPAKGLEFLYDRANPSVIHRDLKCSNILLGEGYHPKLLTCFGLAKLDPIGDKTHVSTTVMGTYGYCAPEYAMTGQLMPKSNVYSFGVVLLEIITGRKAFDYSKAIGEQNLIQWARPLFKDGRKFSQMADPMLQGQYPVKGLYQALAVAVMCLQEQSTMRPPIADVVTALSYLASQKYNPETQPVQSSRMAPRTKSDNDRKLNGGSGYDKHQARGLN